MVLQRARRCLIAVPSANASEPKLSDDAIYTIVVSFPAFVGFVRARGARVALLAPGDAPAPDWAGRTVARRGSCAHGNLASRASRTRLDGREARACAEGPFGARQVVTVALPLRGRVHPRRTCVIVRPNSERQAAGRQGGMRLRIGWTRVHLRRKREA